MKPPICAICGNRFDPFGEDRGLVYFIMRPSDREWVKRREETRMVGHPPYAAWFCENHFRAAKEHGNLTIDEAMPKIRTFYEGRS